MYGLSLCKSKKSVKTAFKPDEAVWPWLDLSLSHHKEQLLIRKPTGTYFVAKYFIKENIHTFFRFLEEIYKKKMLDRIYNVDEAGLSII